MYRKLEDTIYLDFTTHNPSTGAVSDADETPTCEVFEDATDMPILTPTVVKRTDKIGNYRVPVAATTGNGFEVGKSYNVVVSATVGGVAAKGVIGSFSLDGKRNADLNDLGGTAQTGDAFGRIGAAGAGLTALGDARIANLDAAVSSRATLTGIEDSTILAKQAEVLRALGLAQENYYLDTPTYDSNGLLTGCRLRLYSDAASVGTDDDVLATYQITATYTGIRRQTYKVVKQ